MLVVDSQNLSGDPYVALALAATSTTKLGLGTGVTNSVTRHAAATATAITSVNRVSNGRAHEEPTMKASAFIGTSLDGFIARTNGGLDFLPPGGGEPHGYDEFMATVDALVIGRKTFETVLTFDGWPYGEKPVVVLSGRPLAPAPPGAAVERMSGAPAEIVSQLAARGIRHVYVDGGITIQRFLQDGLIQRLIVTRVPVLIGTGIPLFGRVPSDIVLRHVGTRQYASGLVQSEYEVIDQRAFAS